MKPHGSNLYLPLSAAQAWAFQTSSLGSFPRPHPLTGPVLHQPPVRFPALNCDDASHAPGWGGRACGNPQFLCSWKAFCAKIRVTPIALLTFCIWPCHAVPLRLKKAPHPWCTTNLAFLMSILCLCLSQLPYINTYGGEWSFELRENRHLEFHKED